MARTKFFTPVEILRQATSENAELFNLSDKRHSYYQRELGVISEGAYADLLLVSGNPLENIELLADPKMNLNLITKDDKIYKNTFKNLILYSCAIYCGMVSAVKPLISITHPRFWQTFDIIISATANPIWKKLCFRIINSS